ncbi:MAG TPA: GNAT family N-acetyltransferase [Candidatus Binatia bacterium]|nr:GNAT family N-acetyltransferase [Candidatus Binatia bacterium]
MERRETNRDLGSRETDLITIRRASPKDVEGIIALVNHHARRGQLLPRSRQSIAANIDDWIVAAADGQILGCVSLLRYTSGLVEVRSLAVGDGLQGFGIGSRLMQELLRVARDRNIPTLFALTRVVGFFERFGFVVTDRHFFPEKVWQDCQQCPLRDNCDETAVVLDLEES